MKKIIILFLILVYTVSCSETEKAKPMGIVVNEALDHSLQQYLLMAEKYAGNDSILPRSFINGKMTTSDSRWWCSGFFPGSLWYLYEYSHDKKVLEYARQYTKRVEREKYTTSSHDLGFILYCSFGNGLRLTGDSSYKEVLLTGAKSLSTRFNPKVGLIRSWDFNQEVWQYPVIIDNMMNLELLLWASENSPGQSFRNIAVSHADKTMQYHYRPDYSSYHVVSYDTITGKPHKIQTYQGYSDESAWSRGQVWGLYGYTVMFRETKDIRYLEQAKHIANFLIYHPRMPKDYIPYWDFDSPDIPNTLRDASAGAIMASALISLSQLVDKNLSEKYLEVATKQIRTLASADYTAPIGENGNFILKHCVGSLPGNSEVDAPLAYADYYYLEALLKYKKQVLSGK
jgi:unsaturated chondroitin disaccharide hydrolase